MILFLSNTTSHHFQPHATSNLTPIPNSRHFQPHATSNLTPLPTSCLLQPHATSNLMPLPTSSHFQPSNCCMQFYTLYPLWLFRLIIHLTVTCYLCVCRFAYVMSIVVHGINICIFNTCFPCLEALGCGCYRGKAKELLA